MKFIEKLALYLGAVSQKILRYDTHLGHLHPLGETPPVPFYANKL